MPGVTDSRRRAGAILVGLYLLACAGLFVARFHANVIVRPFLVTDDTLQHLAFFEPVAGRPFREVSPQAAYMLDMLPPGAKACYAAGRACGLDTVLTSKLLTATLFAVTLALAFGLGRRVGAIPGGVALFTAVFILDGFFTQLAGGLARSFAYPAVLLAVLGAFAGSTALAALALVASALFYPPMMLFTGAVVVCAAVLPWSLGAGRPVTKRGLATAAVAFVAAVGLALPGLLAARSWGPQLTRAELEGLPEAGPHGRYQRTTALPLASLGATIGMTIDRVARVTPIVPKPVKSPSLAGLGWLFAALAAIPLALARRGQRRPLAVLWLLALGCTGAVTVAFPRLYYPGRTVQFVMPVLFLAGLAALTGRLADDARPGWLRTGLTAVICAAGLALAPAFTAGYNTDLGAERGLYAAIRALPAGALVAGLPSQVLDGVPLFGGRPILAGIETYNLYHRRYLELVRERMNDSLAMTFPASHEQLRALAAKTGARFLLLPTAPLHGECPAFRLFAPYADTAARLCRASDPAATAALPTVWADAGWRLASITE